MPRASAGLPSVPHSSSYLHTPTVPSPPPRPLGGAHPRKRAYTSLQGVSDTWPPLFPQPLAGLSVSLPAPYVLGLSLLPTEAGLLLSDLVHGLGLQLLLTLQAC